MAQQVADYETYKRIKLLGEGAFGKAYLAECVSDNALCVIKQVDLSKMSEQEKKDTLREAKILESFNHPNIVKFKEVYKTKKGKLCIVMDYADGGDLSAKIKAQKTQPFPENQVLDWFTQICLAIKHVHDRKIIHRDLKGQNIFLTSANIIKLGDFGIARVLSSTRENAKTMVGTPYYLSPEIINGKPYSFKSDIWSLGVVLYELCALRPPFDAQSLTFLAMKIVKGQYAPIPYQFSKEMKNLVGSLLQVEPSRRPTVNDVLKNSLIQNRIQNFLSKTVKIQEFSHTVLHKQQFVKNNVKFEDIKSVNNEAPIPSHLLKAQQQQQQQQQDKPKLPVQPAVNKPTPPLINPNALPDDKVKGPSADTPQFNRPQNNQGQDRPQLINYHNNQPKPNFHYRNSPNNPEPEPYKGPKIVDISKEKPVEPKKPDRIPPWQMRSPEEVQKPKVVEPPKNNAINRPQNPFYAEPKPQVQPAINRPEPVKKNEREILGGGLGGGGGLVMNFAPAKNQKEVVKKPAVAAPSSNKKAAAPQKSVADAKREAQLKMLEMKKKMENDKLKRLESEKMKKEKKALEDAERKQVIENQRQEREKDREEMRKKMREDMQNRKDAFRKGKTKDFDVEVVGYQTSSLNDLGKDTEEEEKQEEVIKNEQAAKVHRTREVRAKDERPRESSVPAREPEDEEEEDHVVVVKKANNNKRGPAKFVRNKMNRAFTKNANEGVEIFLPGGKHYDGVDPEESTDRETQEETKLESGVSSKKASPKSERNVEDSEPGQSEEIQKEDPFVEKLEENLENLGEKNEALNPKEIEQVQNISALIDVLNRTVRPELDANEAELTHLEVFSSKSEEQEDRDDDEVDDLCFSESNPADTKKFDPEEESMEYITDYSKLELLQMKLDNILGHDIFLQAYRVAKELFQKHSIDEIEEKYGKEDGYAALFPFMSEEARKHDLRFVFTYVICEEKAEQNGY